MESRNLFRLFLYGSSSFVRLLRRTLLAVPLQLGTDLFRKPLLDPALRRKDAVAYGDFRRASMADEDHPIDSNERGRTICLIVELALEFLKHSTHQNDSGQSKNIAPDFFSEPLESSIRQTLRRLQNHIPDKTIADRNIDGPIEQVISFYVTDVVDPG